MLDTIVKILINQCGRLDAPMGCRYECVRGADPCDLWSLLASCFDQKAVTAVTKAKAQHRADHNHNSAIQRPLVPSVA